MDITEPHEGTLLGVSFIRRRSADFVTYFRNPPDVGSFTLEALNVYHFVITDKLPFTGICVSSC